MSPVEKSRELSRAADKIRVTQKLNTVNLLQVNLHLR